VTEKQKRKGREKKEKEKQTNTPPKLRDSFLFFALESNPSLYFINVRSCELEAKARLAALLCEF